MQGQIYQLTQQSCSMCGQSGVLPREERHTDRSSDEIVVEASWTCYRCGNTFARGEVSRTKANEQETH